MNLWEDSKNLILKLIKYLKIYILFIKIGVSNVLVYRLNFLFGFLVDLGYSLSTLVFVKIVFGRLGEVNGWSYGEILLLNGISILSLQVYLGITYVGNIWRIPEKIRNGDVDLLLLKPLSSLFLLSFSNIYIPSLFVGLPGIFLILYSIIEYKLEVTLLGIFLASIILIVGFVITYSLSIIISSLSFKIEGANSSLAKIPSNVIFEMVYIPHNFFSGFTKIIFYFVIPVIFISSVPTKLLIGEYDYKLVILGVTLGIVFLVLSVKIWNKMLKFYSSSSS